MPRQNGVRAGVCLTMGFGLVVSASGCGNSQTSGSSASVVENQQGNHDKWEQAKANGTANVKSTTPAPDTSGSARSRYMQPKGK